MRDPQATLERAREVAASAAPPTDVLARFERFRSGRLRRQRLTAGAAALVIAAAGTIVVVRGLGGPGEPPSPIVPAEDSPLTGTPRITAEIPLPEQAMGGGVAVGAGSAWVGVAPKRQDGEAKVLRIDLTTNEIVAEIPVRETPWREHIAATADAVWVASAWGSAGLERIDPSTNTVAGRVSLPGRFIVAIAADAEAVWALVGVQDGDTFSTTLFHVDPDDNQVLADIPLGAETTEAQIRIGAGAVWILGSSLLPDDTQEGGDLIRIDPLTSSVVASIPVHGFRMAVGAEDVWVSHPADGILDGKGIVDEHGDRWLWTRVDARTNEPSEPFELDALGLRLVTSEALWSVDYDEQESVRITRFDPETLEMEARSEPIEWLFHDAVIDAESGTVWISAVYSIFRGDIR
jgi:hypothetical protein